MTKKCTATPVYKEFSLTYEPACPKPHILLNPRLSRQCQKSLPHLTLETGDDNNDTWLACDSSASPRLHLSCPYAQPFLRGSRKSCVIILSICVSEPVSMLANLCHTEQTATVVGALKRRGVKNKQNKQKKNVASYLQSSGVYPISGQADEWGREPHDKRSRYGAGA